MGSVPKHFLGGGIGRGGGVVVGGGVGRGVAGGGCGCALEKWEETNVKGGERDGARGERVWRMSRAMSRGVTMGKQMETSSVGNDVG